jgi:predicted amidophosphoribosyltransferase
MTGGPYTREELRSVRDAMPLRGKLCPRCEQFVPEFADLTPQAETRVRELLRNQRPVMAIEEVRAVTGCPLRWAKLWVDHVHPWPATRPGPPCPSCGQPLATAQAKMCIKCGARFPPAVPPRARSTE